MKSQVPIVAVTFLALFLLAQPAQAFEFDFHGSLGKGKHQRYVPPLSNPIFNETPYITTEARPIYIYHRVPSSFVTGGGQVNLFALELRAALTERLGFIASKDGYADVQFDSVLPDTDGFLNFSFGFKYALISEPEENKILTVGIEYEAPTGSLTTAGLKLQRGGDGLIDLFVTGAQAFGKLGLQASTGFNLAIDGDNDSSFWHWAAHADYEILKNFFPMIELNGLTTIDDGTRTAIDDFEGNDVFNFGSTDSGTVVTFGVGARYKFNNHIQMGAGYELPVTDRKDLFDWRTNLDLVITF